MTMWGVEAWRRRKADRQQQARQREMDEMFDEVFAPDPSVPSNSAALRSLTDTQLHRLMGRITDAGQRSAVEWELTRRQGVPALRVAWAAFAVSVLALAASIIIPMMT